MQLQIHQFEIAIRQAALQHTHQIERFGDALRAMLQRTDENFAHIRRQIDVAKLNWERVCGNRA